MTTWPEAGPKLLAAIKAVKQAEVIVSKRYTLDTAKLLVQAERDLSAAIAEAERIEHAE